MTADVSPLVRTMDERETKRRDLVTRDLLGGVTRSAKELDLDLQIPSGWERRLDLLSGEMYLKKSDPDPDPVHDLNLPPPLDLKLLLSPAAPPPSDHQCTLEKVKSALERAGRESRSRRRSDGSPSSPSSSSTTSSSAGKRRGREAEEATAATADGSDSGGKLTAAGCCNCLMFVLISSLNPRCPRCDSHVPIPTAIAKRPRMSAIDLNLNSNGDWR